MIVQQAHAEMIGCEGFQACKITGTVSKIFGVECVIRLPRHVYSNIV